MTKICDLTGTRERKFKRDGSRWQELLGIELELENVNDPCDLPYWEMKGDNSLRNGIEYILDQPYAGESLESALDEFYGAGLKFNNSSRTSTHVHLNMTDATIDTVRSMVMIMYTIEDALYNIVGEGRKWAGYSMALSEMDPIRLRQALSSGDTGLAFQMLAPTRNQERYYGFNTASIRKHGTVEFRYFPGGPTREELEAWLDLIVAVKAAAVDNPPAQLVERIYSPDGMYAFIERYFPYRWVAQLFRAMSPADMYIKFNQVAALAVDVEVVEHKDNIVFLTPSFMKLVHNKLVKDKGRKYLDQVFTAGKALVPGDWLYHLETARAMDNLPAAKPSPKTYGKKISATLAAEQAMQQPVPAWAAEPDEYPVFRLNQANQPPQRAR